MSLGSVEVAHRMLAAGCTNQVDGVGRRIGPLDLMVLA